MLVVERFWHVGFSAAFLDESQEHVFGLDVLMVEPLRLMVGQLHDLPGVVGKSLVHI